MRASITTALSLGLIIALVETGLAQDRNDRRRQFFEGVLRTLVESQVDRAPAPANRPNRTGTRNPQLAASQQVLERFSSESGHLLTALRREEQANSAYRSLLGDVMRIKAGSDVLIRRAPGIGVQQFSNEYQAIDRQWRVVSHRLKQIPHVDRNCLAHVEKLNVLDQQICELLNLKPQLDYLELSRQVVGMKLSLQTLLEDVAYGIGRQPGGQALLVEGQTLLARVDRLGRVIVQDAPHQVVVAEYQQVYVRWRTLARQVRSASDPYITRRLQKIEAAHDAIHELLWIPKAVDRDELLALTRAFQRDLNHIQRGITLDHLIEHPRPEDAVASALALNSSCAKLIESLAGQTSLEELVWDFRALEVEWQTAGTQLSRWGEADLDQRLAAAQRTLDILGRTLGQELTIDHHEIVALVAAIHDGADSLASQTVRLVNTSNQYSSGFRVSAQAAAREFQDAAHHLHESMARHATEGHLKRDCLELATAWAAVQKSVGEFSPQHRGFLHQICRPLGPQIAKMQILYAY